jgi:hypothetical protein
MTSPVPEPGHAPRDDVRVHGERGPLWLAPPQLPPWPVVWLAVEGGPEGGQVRHAIHLWGLAVDDGRAEPRPEVITAGFEDLGGRREPRPEAITADFGDRGGRHAWERFVVRAGEIIEQHPEARWVHCSPGASASVRAHAARHGAPPGLVERLEEAFFELLSRGVRRSVRLPPDSCSVRQVAGLAGFRWRSAPPGPAGSIGRYPKAQASADRARRACLLREIADSNAEELLAMRAVWRWLLEQGPREHCG